MRLFVSPNLNNMSLKCLCSHVKNWTQSQVVSPGEVGLKNEHKRQRWPNVGKPMLSACFPATDNALKRNWNVIMTTISSRRVQRCRNGNTACTSHANFTKMMIFQFKYAIRKMHDRYLSAHLIELGWLHERLDIGPTRTCQVDDKSMSMRVFLFLCILATIDDVHFSSPQEGFHQPRRSGWGISLRWKGHRLVSS